mgnify:CR=1 FL=1
MSWFDRLKRGVIAFREAYVTSDTIDTDDWSDQDARRLRYQIFWSWYEQTAYRDVHSWATAYRRDYAMYKYVRPVYNPAYRLGEFWKSHLFGGPLDTSAGPNGSIPISTDNERLREAIADIWKWSRWDVKKDVLATQGTILGDAAIQVVDDVRRGHVYLELLYPGHIQDVKLDPFGNVKAYTLQETRNHPTRSDVVTYTEEVSRDGEYVVYRTYLNGELYAWNVNAAGEPVSEWAEPYSFIPLVVLQHNDVGLEWGWSELHPIRAKVHEVDDLASQMTDQVRKTVDPIWLMKGMKKTTLTVSGDDSDSDHPAPGREELKAIWGVPIDGDADPMVASLNVAGVLAHIDSILAEIERDIPELAADPHTASGDASGRALRVARQPIVSKVLQRRMNYDAAMVKANQMAVAIGGMRGYYPFDLGSYDKGDLDHEIGDRPVFEEDPLDEIEIHSAFWAAAEQAAEVGALRVYLKEAGWDDDQVAEVENGIEDQRTGDSPAQGQGTDQGSV